ncbi:ankyrin repeat domain-containing protein, partial [Bacillus sp. HC-Mk]
MFVISFFTSCSCEHPCKKITQHIILNVFLNMETALLAATEKNETNTVISLLKKGANINATDSQGRTPLMIATYKNDVKTAKALIEAGADVNIQDDMKNNPFLYAGAEGYLVRWLPLKLSIPGYLHDLHQYLFE